MLTLELIVVVLLALLAGTALGRRFGVAPPLVLLVLGIALGFLPAFRGLTVPPELVLLVVLPALLYWESLTTSLREIRANLRVIVLSSVLLVLVTAGAVAVVLHALGMPWGPAWILGGVLAPTDATAVAGVIVPAGPVGPVGPTAPAGPVGPIAPAAPAGPVGPVAPAAPVGPVGPIVPAAPG